jgi:hypothetical protein
MGHVLENRQYILGPIGNKSRTTQMEHSACQVDLIHCPGNDGPPAQLSKKSNKAPVYLIVDWFQVITARDPAAFTMVQIRRKFRIITPDDSRGNVKIEPLGASLKATKSEGIK